jgi:hypothetical protein
VAAQQELKDELQRALDTLPPAALRAVAEFVAFQRYRLEHQAKNITSSAASAASQATPYQPVRLGSLWQGATVTAEDIEEIRREMWRSFAE